MNSKLLPQISSVMLVLTHACNMHCLYCFVEKHPEYMTYQTAYDTTQFVIQNAEHSGVVPSINFFGGEPMLMWDEIIVPLTLYIRNDYKKPFNLSMTTNGTLLTDERLKFISDTHISLLLSCDGDKETQDYDRPLVSGESSFDALQPWLSKVITMQPNCTFRMTSIPATCKNLYHNIQFASSLGFKNFFTVPNVFEQWNDDAKKTIESEFNKYVDYYIDCYRNGRWPIAFSTMEKAFSDIKRINSSNSSHSFRCETSCKACGKCGLGATRFASIHPSGDIYGCQEMTSNVGRENIFYIGNIYDGVNDDLRSSLMDAYDKVPAHASNCGTCLYNNICDGGCVANNYMITGSLSGVPETYCWWKRVVLSGAVRVMQILGKEENHKFLLKWVNGNG